MCCMTGPKCPKDSQAPHPCAGGAPGGVLFCSASMPCHATCGQPCAGVAFYAALQTNQVVKGNLHLTVLPTGLGAGRYLVGSPRAPSLEDCSHCSCNADLLELMLVPVAAIVLQVWLHGPLGVHTISCIAVTILFTSSSYFWLST